MVPAVLAILKQPALMPPTVAGPITILFSCLAVAAISRARLSGTPSAIITTVLMVLAFSASIDVLYALRKDEKFITTSALGNFFVAASNVGKEGIKISPLPKKNLCTLRLPGSTIAATEGVWRAQIKSKSSIRCMAFC